MKDIPIEYNLSNDKRHEVYELVNEYRDIFTNDSMKPKWVKVMKHRIVTNDALPQFRKLFRIPHAVEEEVNKQVNKMLENEIIRPSSSPWNSPVLLVKKIDKGLMFVWFQCAQWCN